MSNVSFDKLLSREEIAFLGDLMVQISERQKQCFPQLQRFFDGNDLIVLPCSARDYFLHWINPTRDGIAECAYDNDDYLIRVKEIEGITILECKNAPAVLTGDLLISFVDEIKRAYESLMPSNGYQLNR